MTRRPHRETVDPSGPYDPQVLLNLLDAFPDTVIVGFESTPRHVDLHVKALPPDPRAGAAGLFGLRALPGWGAAGVAFGARARHMATGAVIDDEAYGAVVVTRDGGVASRLVVGGGVLGEDDQQDRDGEDREELDRVIERDEDRNAPVGTLLDGLHRFLGLPSPGTPPHPIRLAAAVWAHQMLEVLLVEGALDWDEAIGLHPGDPGPGSALASDEMLLEATLRATEGFDWADLHSRASRGVRHAYGLSRREAAWMDTTMFARWVTGSLPDPRLVVHALRAHGCEGVADRFGGLLDALDRLEPSPHTGPTGQPLERPGGDDGVAVT